VTVTGQFLPGLVTLSRLREASLNLKSVTLQFALAKDEAAMKVQSRAFQTLTEQVTRDLADLKIKATDEQSQTLIAAFETSVKSYLEDSGKFQMELRGGEFEKAMASLDEKVNPAQQKLENELRAINERYAELSGRAGDKTVAARGISARLHETNQALATSTDVINASAAMMASSRHSLADGSSSQAATIEETSVSLEELSSMTKRNAESAQQAKQAASQARASADTGAERMRAAIQAITSSSADISKILKNT